MTQPGQSETVAFLTGLAGGPAAETHISFVFLGQDTAWKLKKAVRLPFLDFTALADRRHFCERELALNAPAAPGLYRDVVPVTRQPDGSLALDGTGEPVDWVVRMARVPAGDFIDVRAAAGELPGSMLDRIADAVAAYHIALPPIRDFVPVMAAIAQGNIPSALSAGLPEDKVARWRDAMLSGLARRAAWQLSRAEGGFVRRCHGDLHLGNLCLWRGQPALFDALEFDERLARIDTAYDFAFLLMDLEHRIGRAAANRVLNRYVARTGDAGLTEGLPVFLSMRATIRAHVEARSGHAGPAMVYLDAALGYLSPLPPVVVAVGGLPGTGKSTLARALAPCLGAAPGALVPRSDEIRKRRFGVPPEQRLPAAAYAPEVSAAVLRALTEQIAAAVGGGHAAVADATFMDPAHRAMVEEAAARAGVPFVGLWLSAPASMLWERVAARTGDASDATVEVLRNALASDPGAGAWHAIDASDAAGALTLAKQLLRPYIAF